jgi:hypothetical protein
MRIACSSIASLQALRSRALRPAPAAPSGGKLDGGKRAGNWETTIGAYFTGSEAATASTAPPWTSIAARAGLRLGYNFTEHLALRFDGSWSRADYDAGAGYGRRRPGRDQPHACPCSTASSTASTTSSPGAFTPYLQAGIGWTYVDSNVADGPPVTGCWWDPWWGYICSNFYSTYTETKFPGTSAPDCATNSNRGMFLRGGWERRTSTAAAAPTRALMPSASSSAGNSK